MKKSEILKKCVPLIKSCKEEFICEAIRRIVRDSSRADHQHGDSLRAWIHMLLDGFGTYESWLQIKHPDFNFTLRLETGKCKRRVGRLQWLNWMIAHWEAQGE